jgi:hypothetical protein
VECNGKGAKLHMRYGHLFDNIQYLQMPFDFATSVLFEDEIFATEESDSEVYQIEMTIPLSAFELQQTDGAISYGGTVEGAEGLLTDDSGVLTLGSSLPTTFTCVYSDNISVDTSTSVKQEVRSGGVPLDAIVYRGDVAFQLDSSVDSDSPPKIGDTVTLTVTPNAAFTENDPIVYHISKISASDPNDDTVSAIIYKNPCAFSFIDLEFSTNAESTDLTQAQSFSLKSFVFHGSTGIEFEVEMKCKTSKLKLTNLKSLVCVLDENGEPLDAECIFDDACSLPYAKVGA